MGEKLKEPKTFEEQIEILKNRNLIINNEILAKKVLSTTNYYRFTVYGLHLKKDNKFIDGTTFEFVYGLYNFDKKLRHLLMGALETIEISFRTYIAYTLAHEYKALGYLNENNFKIKEYHKRFMVELHKEEYNYNKNELFIQHHINKYQGKLPIWVAVEIMSFGIISRVYGNLKTEDRSKMANDFIGINHHVVNSWIISLTELRNACAHYSRVYNKNFVKTPDIHKKYSKCNLDKDKLFTRILAMKYLVPHEEEWKEFLKELKNLIDTYKECINLDLIGFPNNWNEILSKDLS